MAASATWRSVNVEKASMVAARQANENRRRKRHQSGMRAISAWRS
jgi:hypothetical protein